MLNPRALLRVFPAALVAWACLAGSAETQAPQAPHEFHAALPNRETLDYEIEWRLVTAGNAKLQWYSSPALPNGWESKLHLESTGMVSRLFHVADDYTAQMTANLCATSTFMTAREGSRSRDTKVTFDSKAKRAYFFEKDLKTNAVVKNDIDIAPCVHDVTGALMALRAMNLEPGKTAQIPVSNGKKNNYLKVEAQRREDIKVPAGPEKTIRYEVFAFDNQLYNRPGHLHIWLTDDARRIPVQIQIRLQFTIGTITLRLYKETEG